MVGVASNLRQRVQIQMPDPATLQGALSGGLRGTVQAKVGQRATNAALHNVLRGYPYPAAALVEYGLTRSTAYRAVQAAAADNPLWGAVPWADELYNNSPADFADAHYRPHPSQVLVALVASNPNGIATYTLAKYGCYLRACSLRQPIRQGASYLGTDVRQHIPYVQPILARLAFNGTPTHLPPNLGQTPYTANLRRAHTCIADPRVQDAFGGAGYGPYEVFVLGNARVELGTPLGYKNRGGLQGTRHYTLADLRNTPTLKAANQPPLASGPWAYTPGN